MSINAEIIQALKSIAPVALHEYAGNSETYITFFTFSQRSGLSADDEEKATIFSLQVDIYGKGNIEELTKQVKTALKAIGFRRTTEMELFEETTKTYRRNLSFTGSRKTEQ